MDTTLITAFVGAIATIAAAWITARAKDKTVANLEKELALLRKNPLSTSVLSREEYGIEIVSPSIGEQVAHTFPVNGIFRKLPEGYEIWVYTTSEENHIRKYWPQERATIKGSSWYSKVNYLGGLDDAQTILAFVVGKQGQALIHYFKTAGDINRKWPGIIQLTYDMVECASTTVVCNK